MFGIVQQIAVYLGGSAKHLAVYREIDDEVEGSGMPKRKTVRSLSDTRWGSRCDAPTTLKSKIFSVIAALERLGNGPGGDAQAQTLLSAICSFRFIVSFIIAEHLLNYTVPLSNYL